MGSNGGQAVTYPRPTYTLEAKAHARGQPSISVRGTFSEMLRAAGRARAYGYVEIKLKASITYGIAPWLHSWWDHSPMGRL